MKRGTPLVEADDLSVSDNGDEDKGARKKRSRKRGWQYDVMTGAQENDLVEFFDAHPEFYDQSLQGFKLKTEKEALLDDLGDLIGCSGEC